MNIELGSIGSAVGSAASTISRGATSMGRISGEMPSTGAMPGGFGLSAGPAFEAAPIINEGPVGLADFKNTMPLYIGQNNPVSELRFDNPVGEAVSTEPLSVESVVAEAESILSQARLNPVPVAEPGIIKIAKPADLPAPAPLEAPVAETQPQLQPATEVRIDSQPSQAVSPLYEEEVVEEKKIVDQQNQEDEKEVQESEDSSQSRIKFVEAVKISDQRRRKIKDAVKKAEKEGITVAKALSGEFWKYKSPIVGDGKDWTIDLTVQALQIDPGKYKSVAEAEEVSVASVDKNIPVEEGEKGRQATVDEVRKVTYGEVTILNAKTPAEIVERRLVKKRIQIAKTGEMLKVLEDKVETSSESTLKDLNLAEVFSQKAA